jgi:hypothetical protein
MWLKLLELAAAANTVRNHIAGGSIPAQSAKVKRHLDLPLASAAGIANAAPPAQATSTALHTRVRGAPIHILKLRRNSK